MFKINNLIIKSLSLFILTLSLNAQAIEFKAEYSVKAKGINIGTAKQSLSCSANDCVLTSSAKPPKWAFFINESSKETINLSLQDNELIWQTYYKELTRKKSGKTRVKNYEIYRDSANQKIVSIQKNMDWPEQKYAFDMISIVHALRFYAKKHSLDATPLPVFYLQEDNKQYKLDFTTQHQEATAHLNYKSNLDAYYYEWNSDDKQVKVWLIKELDLFPGLIELYDKKDNNKLVLQLKNHPKVN